MLGTLQWTSIPFSGGSRNSPSCFMLQKLQLNTGIDKPPASFNPLDFTLSFSLILNDLKELCQGDLADFWPKLYHGNLSGSHLNPLRKFSLNI